MINFIDYKSNYCHVFLARTQDAAVKLFEHFLVYFEKEFDCKIHVLRTDSGGEYENVDLFCKRTGVTRQRSEARNYSSDGKAKRMHRTIMNMAWCMIFACGLPLKFWGDAVQYGRASPLKVLTGKSPQLGEIVVFGSPCTVYRDSRKKNFAQLYLPKDRVVATTQHVNNIEALDKEQNLLVQRLYLRDETSQDAETPEGKDQASVAEATSARIKKKRASSKEKSWTREHHVTRSVAKNAGGVTNEAVQPQEPARDIVNSVTEYVMGLLRPTTLAYTCAHVYKEA
uniref:Integrase catalytic domain-containing protein n=1 Tax=Phytophthora ramorum TaxID=164328 RepID=H3GBI1_PHYRM